MLTYIVHQPNRLKAERVTKKLEDDHALAEAQFLLDTHATNRVFLRTEGSNILWAMHKVDQSYLMAGTLIQRKKRTKIPVTYIES